MSVCTYFSVCADRGQRKQCDGAADILGECVCVCACMSVCAFFSVCADRGQRKQCDGAADILGECVCVRV